MAVGLKIIALGTSLTATPLWTGEFKVRLESCLRADVEVQTVAKGGATSRWGIQQTQQVILARPDVLLVEFAANDADLRRLISVAESKQNHVEIIQGVRLANPDIKVFLMAVNPTWGVRGSWIRPRLDAYYGLYADLAKSMGVGFIDIRPRWLWSSIGDTVPDGLHPTSRAMMEIVAPYLAEVVCGQLNERQ